MSLPLSDEKIEELVSLVIHGRKSVKKVADESDGLITVDILTNCVRWKRQNPDKPIQHIGSRGRGLAKARKVRRAVPDKGVDTPTIQAASVCGGSCHSLPRKKRKASSGASMFDAEVRVSHTSKSGRVVKMSHTVSSIMNRGLNEDDDGSEASGRDDDSVVDGEDEPRRCRHSKNVEKVDDGSYPINRDRDRYARARLNFSHLSTCGVCDSEVEIDTSPFFGSTCFFLVFHIILLDHTCF